MTLPNLLFIFTDQQLADTLAVYGNDKIEMPCLNKLASESFVFKRTYVTQGVCTPSRASLLTGLYPHTCGCTENNMLLPQDVACFPEMLSRGDYFTGFHGKWHLGDEIYAQHGFSEWRSVEDSYREYYSKERNRKDRSSYHHFLVAHGIMPSNGEAFSRREAAQLPEKYSKPSYLGSEASRFIRENRNNNFILFVNFLEPHNPYTSPRDDQYNPADVSLPESFFELPSENRHIKIRLIQRALKECGRWGVPFSTDQDARRIISNYWGLCSLVDTHVGRILSTLEETGLSHNTIIVFTSDHGDLMGSHRLLGKCVNFEEVLRVPLLIHLPRQKDSRIIEEPISQIDLVPTLLDLLKQPIPKHLQGRSLRSFIEGRENFDSRDVFIEWNGPNNGFGDKLNEVSIPDCMLRNDSREKVIRAMTDPIRTIVTPEGWKFNYSQIGEHELYNLYEDPLETDNLARKKEMRTKMKDLACKIREWQKQTDDSVAFPEF